MANLTSGFISSMSFSFAKLLFEPVKRLFRGTYCALAIAKLLHVETPELLCNVARFVVSCQTYEGGIGS